MSETNCTNCGRRAGTGGAKGLCGRCYQHARRHEGELPSAELRHEELPERVTVRLDGELLRQARRLARAEGVTLSTWLRHAAQGVVLREVARERGRLDGG